MLLTRACVHDRCEKLCERCDADAGFKLINDDGLRYGAYTFDASKLTAGSNQPRNMCALARYGNGGVVNPRSSPIASAKSYATLAATGKPQQHWYGSCANGDSKEGQCCANANLLDGKIDWDSFSHGSTCAGNTETNQVVEELSCIFSEEAYEKATAPPKAAEFLTVCCVGSMHV
jgi:hypothetical protein